MKKIFLSPVTYLTFLFVLVFSDSAFSQDDIIMLNNDVIKAKVEEVGVNLIKYRKADNMDGPIYDMPKGDVYMIVYANGARDVINGRQGDVAQGDNTPAPPIRTAPPEMPVYEQPPCPMEGYLWTPGYWAFGILGYYWVPGVWVRPPHIGFLWTPGYWGYGGGVYGWHEGYWGEHIGYYGGVNYGYGYGGRGYEGGRWEGGAFRYNTAVSRVDVTVVHTTYVDNTVVRNTTVVNRSSFNGEGGVKAEPTPMERKVMTEKHVIPTPEQQTHVTTAKSDKSQYVSANGGKPTVAAMNKPDGQHFSPEGHAATPHPNSLPQVQHPAGNPTQPQQHPAGNTLEPQQHPAGNALQQNTQPAQQHPAVNTQQQHEQLAQPQQHPGGNTLQQHPAGNALQQNTQPVQPQQHPAGNMQMKNNKINTPKPAPKPAPKINIKQK